MSEPLSDPVADSTKMEYPDDPAFDDNALLAANGKIEMDQEEVDAIIRNKRKVRDPKACYACHRRKVKCDRNLPCDSCVKRDHPELCSYERPSKKKRIALNNNLAQQGDATASEAKDFSLNSGPNITVPKEQWERINAELQRLKAAVNGAQSELSGLTHGEYEETHDRSDFTEREGVHAPSTQMGTMHLGSRSILAYMMGNKSKSSQDAARVLLEEDILPNLGLDNETATYPFIDLWSTESSIQDVSGLCRALPEDGLCREFWTAYRDITCNIYPVVADLEAFENSLNYFLSQRAEHLRQHLEIDATKPYGVSMPWLALLFAVLASGAQSTSRTAKERELTSQVYICCSYQALRMANFLSHACIETIQACLVIGNALAYNMNPGVAYIVLGMTLRSALTIGLHVTSQKFSEHENYIRGRIWWALAWQDSHFSVSYDRPSSSILCFPEIPYTKQSSPGNRSYVESMSAMIRVTQQILRDRTLNPRVAMTWSAIQNYKDELSRVVADAKPRLRDSSQCTQLSHHLSRLAFTLHSAYMISEVCRPALRESAEGSKFSNAPIVSPKHDRRTSNMSAQSPSSVTESSVKAQLRADCIANLERVIDTFIETHERSTYAARSWIGIQRSISAAFLLGILPETRQEPRVIQLLMQLEQCLAARAHEEAGFDSTIDDELQGGPESRRISAVNVNEPRSGISESPNWARSMSKSLHALGKLNAALSNKKVTKGSQSLSSINTGLNNPMYSAMSVSPVSGATYSGGMSNHGMIMPNTLPQYQAPNLTPHGHVQRHHHHQQHPSLSNISIKNDLFSPLAQSSYSLSAGGIPRPSSGAGLSSLGLGPVTPDSGSVCSGGSGNDWSTGNFTERALEFVAPGLWG